MDKIAVIIALITILSGHHQVSAPYMLCLAEHESDYRTDAVSSAGAMNVFQLMPETAAWWAELSGLSGDMTDVLTNINMACWAVAHGYAKHWSTDKLCRHLKGAK